MKFPQPHLGKLIRRLIADRGLNQTEIARRLGISSNTVHKSLRQKEFRFYRLRQYSEILGEDLFVHLLSEENRKLLAQARELKEAAKEAEVSRALIGKLQSELQAARNEAAQEKAQVDLLKEIMKGRE